MKLRPLITAAITASTLLLTSCGNSEKDALDAFKKSSEELNALTSEKPADPMAGMAQMKAVFAKMEAIKTDGLPADLKDAFTAFRSKFSEMSALLKDMPEKKEDLLTWSQKMMTDPSIGAKFGQIASEIGPLGEKLSEVAKKHGITVKMNQ